jgi:hypothetical protein
VVLCTAAGDKSKSYASSTASGSSVSPVVVTAQGEEAGAAMAGGDAEDEGVPSGEEVSASTRSSDMKFGVETAEEAAEEEAAAGDEDVESQGGDASRCTEVALFASMVLVVVADAVTVTALAGWTAVMPFLKPLTPKKDTSMLSFAPEERKNVNTRNRPYTGRAKR